MPSFEHLDLSVLNSIGKLKENNETTIKENFLNQLNKLHVHISNIRFN